MMAFNWIAFMLLVVLGSVIARNKMDTDTRAITVQQEIGKYSLTASTILTSLSAFQLLQMKVALLGLILAGVYVFWYKLFPEELMKMEDPDYEPSFQGLL